MAKKKAGSGKGHGGTAVIYARYSSHNQKDASIEQQVAQCMQFAAAQGMTVVATYEDRAISGKTDKRPNFQRMLRDAEKGKFSAVLAWKSNRMGRNMLQAMVNEAKLNECGVRCLYTEEDFDDTAAGRFALRSMMNVNQFYSENMAEDIMRGMEDNAKKCLCNGSLPLGYMRGQDGRIVLNEVEADVVREIFTRVAANESFADIARDLNNRGIKTRKKAQWNKNSFRGMCRNERYRGIYIFRDVRIEGGIPRMVDDETWFKVQGVCELKQNRGQTNGRHHGGADDYLLTGKLRCGHCGSYMTGISGTSKTGAIHYYYICHKRRTEHACDKKNVRREVIELAVARAIMEYCLNDETILYISDSTIKHFENKEHELHISAMEDELADVSKSIDNIMKAIEAGIFTDSTKNRLLKLEEDKRKISARLAEAKAEIIEIDRDSLIAGLKMMRSGDIRDKHFLSELFRTFLMSVYLYDDNRLKLVFSFSGDNNTVEIPLDIISGVGEDVEFRETVQEPGGAKFDLTPQGTTKQNTLAWIRQGCF